MEQNLQRTGIVFGIQRFSIHDGPGIRTTVFLKGCNVACKWCHNPESIQLQPTIGYNAQRCIRCGACAQVCPKGCHLLSAEAHRFDRAGCIACGECAEACPAQALERIGKAMTVDEAYQALMKDRRYYQQGGGITVSGGEALLQKEFVIALLKRCRESGVHCALETNGIGAFSNFQEVMPYVDLFLLDYKATDPEVHRRYVGCDNRIVLENLRKLYDADAQILLRCPIIPGVNDDRAHLDAIAQMTREFPKLVGAEILPYHKLGVSKALRMDVDYMEFESPSAEMSDAWKRYIAKQGGRLINAE